jgi:hypothetical protein
MLSALPLIGADGGQFHALGATEPDAARVLILGLDGEVTGGHPQARRLLSRYAFSMACAFRRHRHFTATHDTR